MQVRPGRDIPLAGIVFGFDLVRQTGRRRILFRLERGWGPTGRGIDRHVPFVRAVVEDFGDGIVKGDDVEKGACFGRR